jgi:DNA-binding GntR family transcriptional regulator
MINDIGNKNEENLIHEFKNRKATPTILADILRRAIFKGELKGGQQIRQTEIAEQFGTSRIPVREALKQLEAEGLITLNPNKGAVISTLSAKEAKEIYEIRELLETGAVKFSIENVTESDLAKAESILKEIDSESDAGKWLDLNWEFHSCLYSPAERPKLISIINNLHINVNRYIRIYLELMNYEERSQAEHYEILDAYRNKDLEKAVQATIKHLQHASNQLVTYLSETIK